MTEQPTPDQVTKCPKCLNEIGFVFGTCNDCGWNHLDNSWRFISVWSPDPTLDGELIEAHAHRIERRRQARQSRGAG